ncbi:AzlC family ABC transporter permease [Alloiococcus sp. CFN-8]|uniref:AzlC family ABC transporter permease n=1 Tax=Alloiococcus sp. CFN-8 TaxID=3416081 RepID=UPI003CF433E4
MDRNLLLDRKKVNEKQYHKQSIKTAFLTTIPVMTGYLVLSIGFGVLLNTKGYGVPWALAMSLGIYAGSMQFVAIDLLGAGASLITVALTTLTVNARHLFYGISMIDKYENTGKIKPYLMFSLTDETYSLVCNDAPSKELVDKKSYYFFVSLFNQLYWVIGSVIGVLLGAVIPFNTEGIDFALTALFITVFVEQWLEAKNHLPAIIGVVASVINLLIFGSDNFLIPSMISIVVILTLLRKKEG